jgi:hypothetical protein
MRTQSHGGRDNFWPTAKVEITRLELTRLELGQSHAEVRENRIAAAKRFALICGASTHRNSKLLHPQNARGSTDPRRSAGNHSTRAKPSEINDTSAAVAQARGFLQFRTTTLSSTWLPTQGGAIGRRKC